MSWHYDQRKFVLALYFHALGHACKFVLRCKKIYRIGHRQKLCQEWGQHFLHFWVFFHLSGDSFIFIVLKFWCASRLGVLCKRSNFYQGWEVFTADQTSAIQGPVLRLVLEAIIKPLISKSSQCLILKTHNRKPDHYWTWYLISHTTQVANYAPK